VTRPLAIDLCCGLGGWTEGLIAEGYRVIGYDIEAHEYGEEKYPGELRLENVLTLNGAQFKDAALIVASPPCQKYSWMAMPFSRGRAEAARIRADKTGAALAELNAIFDACFRIQREACKAAGRHIPMVVENVKGAQPWVGRSRWNFGSYHLWGDVPALMPKAIDGSDLPGYKAVAFNDEAIRQSRRTAPGKGARFTTIEPAEAKKLAGYWFGGYAPGVQGPRNHGSKSKARKAASARIAKIPPALSSWIARTYKPTAGRAA
jgi:site-specific DNA-cytosine methylase